MVGHQQMQMTTVYIKETLATLRRLVVEDIRGKFIWPLLILNSLNFKKRMSFIKSVSLNRSIGIFFIK